MQRPGIRDQRARGQVLETRQGPGARGQAPQARHHCTGQVPETRHWMPEAKAMHQRPGNRYQRTETRHKRPCNRGQVPGARDHFMTVPFNP